MRLGGASLLAKARPDLPAGGACLLCIRPHGIAVQPSELPSNELVGIVRGVQWQGDLHSIDLEAEGAPIRMICTPMRDPPALDARLRIHFAAEDATLIPEEAARDG